MHFVYFGNYKMIKTNTIPGYAVGNVAVKGPSREDGLRFLSRTGHRVLPIKKGKKSESLYEKCVYSCGCRMTYYTIKKNVSVLIKLEIIQFNIDM